MHYTDRFAARLVIMLAFLLLPTGIQAQTWVFDSGLVRFNIRNAGLKVDGEFSGLRATVDFQELQPEKARIEGSVEASSIQTGIIMRDRHLRGKDYFDAASHPKISMKLQKLEKSGNQFSGLFQLSMKGRIKEIRLPLQFTKKSPVSSSLESSFTLNRLDFGIGKSSWTLGDDVSVQVLFHLKMSGD
jgi:polyisoprenoid-binding protein YceI